MELLGECNLGILENLSEDAIEEITESYGNFFTAVESLIGGDSSVEQELVCHVSTLCKLQYVANEQGCQIVYNSILNPRALIF